MSSDILYVVCVLSNPLRFKSRWALYERFITNMMKTDGIHLTTVELTYGDAYGVAEHTHNKVCEKHVEIKNNKHTIIRLTTTAVLWHKENIANIGFGSLPCDWRYGALIDADITFVSPTWVEDTINALQHYAVVQPWSHAVDLDSQNQMVEPFKPATSFLSAWDKGLSSNSGRYDDHNFHTGYAIAINKSIYQALGGWLDSCILGSADRSMMCSLVGKAHLSYPNGVTQGYKDYIHAWQDRCNAYVQKNVTGVAGLITHGWHGPKVNRGYVSRWKLLIKNQFNPATDLKYDYTQHGLLDFSHMTTDRMQSLRKDIRDYMKSRQEDQI